MSDNEHAEEREEADGAQRGRPGRRSVQGRKHAVLLLLAGKATADQLARQSGVRPETDHAGVVRLPVISRDLCGGVRVGAHDVASDECSWRAVAPHDDSEADSSR